MPRHQPPSAAPVQFIAQRVLQPLERFLHVEASSGIVLLAAAVTALVWANSPWSSSYEHLWHVPLTFGAGSLITTQPLHFWINDGLMTVFFLVAGLEIRREISEGALSSLRLAALPLAAALGGIAAPAAIYLALNREPVLQEGWAVPTATDIAFAVGVLTLLGRRVPPALRVLLLALAIIDDIAAILIIAFFYSSGVTVSGLLVAVAGVGGVYVFQILGVRHATAYVLPGFVVWAGMLLAGMHPTLAGVILGLLTPVLPADRRERLLAAATRAIDEFHDRLRHDRRDANALVQPVQQLKRAQREMLPPVVRVQIALHPWVAYGIMPLFALTNAGIRFEGLSFESVTTVTLAWGIGLALVLGKPLGILAAALLAVRLRLSALPEGVSWRGILLIGCLGGIGFTMSIFIANLAFADPLLLATAKFAVLVGSTIAALAGLMVGWLARPVPRAAADST